MIVAGFDTAADGIAREMALLQRGQPAVMLWQSATPALVLPSALLRRSAVQDAAELAEQGGWRVTARHTGGGIVPQGPGTLNLALVLPCPPGFRLEEGYHLICGALSEALTRFDVQTTTGACDNVFCDGTWNLLADGRKLAGTAQRRRSIGGTGSVALIHAALLTDMPAPAAWPVMDRLHRAAFPDTAGLRPEAHIALTSLLGAQTNKTNFPGALARAAEDRLTSLTNRESKAA